MTNQFQSNHTIITNNSNTNSIHTNKQTTIKNYTTIIPSSSHIPN